MTIHQTEPVQRRRRLASLLGASAVAAALLAGTLASGGSAFAAVPAVGTTEIASVNEVGAFGAAASGGTTSADGRYVVFESTSAYAGVPTAGTSQIFRKDLTTGAIVLVSAAPDGAPGNKAATQASVSADGRFVAFVSNATNLDPAHKSDMLQVFVRDLNTGGTTKLITVNSDKSAGGDAPSLAPSIAGNGSSVAFQSTASDLVPGTTGTQVFQATVPQMGTPGISVISMQDLGMAAAAAVADADATTPASSYDGSVVAFVSGAANLTKDTNMGGVPQVFARDRRTQSTTLVSAAAGAAIAGDRPSSDPTISADGRVVAFASTAANIASGPAGTTTTISQVFLRELEKGRASTVVSKNFAGTGAADSSSAFPAISADGRRVAFTSASTNATDIPNATGLTQVIVRDLPRGLNSMVSVEMGNPVSGLVLSSEPFISADGRFAGFSTAAERITATNTMGMSAVYLRGIASDAGPVGTSVIERIGGADRYAVSASTSALKFNEGVPVAYVASGAVFPDALSGSAAAGLESGPVLLTEKDGIPSVVAAELKRLKPGRIVLLGGTASVSPAVQTALAEFVGKDAAKVTRIEGADRYDVSAKVSEVTFKENVGVAYVASGEVFPDALSGSAAAGLKKGPVLLVTKGGVPEKVKAELARLKPKAIVVLGGTATVAETVITELKKTVIDTKRLAGADRYVLSAEVANASFLATGGTVFVASGQVFPDALSGSAAAIRAQAPVLLVTSGQIPGDVAGQLTRLKPTRIVVLGGENTISAAVYEQLRGYLAK
jgi:putative cell wall-binding protein/Tol biopolymer transport system component